MANFGAQGLVSSSDIGSDPATPEEIPMEPRLALGGAVTYYHMGGLDSGDLPLSWTETDIPGTGNAPGGLVPGTEFIQSEVTDAS